MTSPIVFFAALATPLIRGPAGLDLALLTCKESSDENYCRLILSRALNENFHIYVPGTVRTSATRFTAYYSPDLTGSRTPTQKFTRPIYRQPPTEIARSFTRVQIDHDNKLSGRNLEIFWVENSFFDIYLLHVQGGGRITLDNGEIKYLSMTGHNGKKCEFIGHHMARMGWLPKDEALRVPRKREFLEAFPEKNREAFRNCQNYIYFRESSEEPVGRNNIPLTEGRSIALDHTLYPSTGLITFVRVDIGRKLMSRIMIAQDTGSKIRGPARSDLYMGYGSDAERTAVLTSPGWGTIFSRPETRSVIIAVRLAAWNDGNLKINPVQDLSISQSRHFG